MASLVDICNMALSRFGGQRITDIEQPVESARVCKLFWPNVRDSALRDYPWNFCIKRVALAAMANETDPEWPYIYQYPSDCLRTIKLYSEATVAKVQPEKFIVRAAQGGGRRIYAKLPDAYLEYHAQIVDPTQYDPEFIDAIAWRLAADICVPLSDDKNMREHLMAVYLRMLAAAWNSNANEGYEDPKYENPYVDVRN